MTKVNNNTNSPEPNSTSQTRGHQTYVPSKPAGNNPQTGNNKKK